MIELLTVMAIIAVLAGITFPVFARVRENAYKSSDISNMANLSLSIQLYKQDQDAYPPAILGYASLYTVDSNVVPADKVVGFVYPNKVSNIEELKPSTLRATKTAYTKAVWPNQDPAAVGSAPYDGLASGCIDTAGSRQKYGPTQLVKRVLTHEEWQIGQTNGLQYDIEGVGIPTSGATVNAYFYDVSGYDVATVKEAGGTTRTELRYTRFWTNKGLGGGDRCDDPRQLGYIAPPGDTVVTWNSQYRDYDSNGVATNTKKDVVLYLTGGARPASSSGIDQKSWRYSN